MKKKIIPFCLALLFCGCSLKPGPTRGVTVRLQTPQQSVAPSVAPSLALFSQAPPPIAPIPIANQGCYQINAYGSLAGSTSTCGGAVKTGVLSQVQTDINSTFQFVLPGGGPVTFEAYAFPPVNGTCPSIGAAFGDTSATSPELFKIGSAAVNVSPDGATISIPVGFANSTVGINCGSAPYQFFGDPFVYTTAALGNTTDWTTTNGSIPILSGAGGGAINLSVFGAVPNSMQLNYSVDRTKNVLIAMDINYSSTSAGNPQLILGLTNSAGSSVFACDFKYFPGPPDNIAIGSGSDTSISFPTATFGSNYSLTTSHKLVCIIENLSTGVQVIGRVFDPSGNQIGSDQVTSGLTQDLNAVYTYFYYNGNATTFTTGTTATSFLIQQSTGLF